jgi:hypothetical protein
MEYELRSNNLRMSIIFGHFVVDESGMEWHMWCTWKQSDCTTMEILQIWVLRMIDEDKSSGLNKGSLVSKLVRDSKVNDENRGKRTIGTQRMQKS